MKIFLAISASNIQQQQPQLPQHITDASQLRLAMLQQQQHQRQTPSVNMLNEFFGQPEQALHARTMKMMTNTNSNNFNSNGTEMPDNSLADILDAVLEAYSFDDG